MSDSYNEKTDHQPNNPERFFDDGGINRFGERLKTAIGAVSYRSFAAKCQMSDKVIRNYVAGETYPSLDRIAVLAEAAGVSAMWLAFGVEKSADKTVDTSASAEHQNDDSTYLYKAFQRLSSDSKDEILSFIMANGMKSLASICTEENAELVQVSPKIKQLLIAVKDLPDAKIREIFSAIESGEVKTCPSHNRKIAS